MRRRFLFLTLLLAGFTALPCAAQYKASPYGELGESEHSAWMRRHAGTLACAAFEGRAAGSEGEREAARYVTEVLRESGVDVLSGAEGDIFGMKLPEGDTLVSRNVVGFIPGYDRTLKDHYVVVGARLDGPGTRTVTRDGVAAVEICPGANGNASGAAMLLALGRMLQTNSVLLRRSVLLVFFGASEKQQAGAWYFLNRSFPDTDKIDAMVNIDMVGTPSNGFYAYTASNACMNEVVRALEGTLQPVRPVLVAAEPVASDHRAFYDRKIPSIFFTTGMYREWRTPRDTPSVLEYEGMDRVLEYIHNYTLSVVNGPRPDFEPKVQKEEGGSGGTKAVPYYECDWKPSFLGSTDPGMFLKKWVYVYLRYPESCVREGVQGTVQVDFIIDERGKVRDVRVLKGVDPRLDEEAVRVISASPDWKPGRVRGQKVKAEMTLYVEFRLERKKK